MNTRKLGWTDLQLSEIGLGAWAIGGGGYAFGWGTQDDNESINAIHRALDLGINWIDTAPVYGLGHSEQIVGKAIKDIRDKAIIATKCSLVWKEDKQVYSDLSRDSVINECEQSLKRLGIDCIDLYQVHWPNDEEHIEEGWEAIGELIKSGKIRYAGVSNFAVDHMQRAQKLHPIASLQPPYSIMRRKIESDAFPYCRENKIGVVAYSPMQSGLLTEGFDIKRLAQDDWRLKTAEFNEPNLAINLWFAGELKKIAANYGKTTAQLAIAWTLRLDVVTCSIVGARRPSQVDEIVGGADWKISPNDLQRIDQLYEERINRITEVNGVVRR